MTNFDNLLLKVIYLFVMGGLFAATINAIILLKKIIKIKDTTLYLKHFL